jgi:lipopolysaccharide transport system ATP-binding protein
MVPGNLLAEGGVFILAAIVSYTPSSVHALVEDAAAFHVLDTSTGDGARGTWTGDFPGLVRPKLEWEEWEVSAS